MADLRAVVVGAGWAGEGHTRALQWCGVAVAAICARDRQVVRAVADRLDVAEASTDWRRTLATLRPDIVTIATPATLRGPVVEAAAELGAHILCDKPLAATGEEAGRLCRLVESAGVKHAYGATHRYDPSVAWLGELVREGSVGKLREVTGSARSLWGLGCEPWCWAFLRAEGGGDLNNTFTHRLAVLEAIVGGPAVRAMGEARVVRGRAPVLPGLHDVRTVVAAGRALTPEQAAALEWRPVDGEGAFCALLRFRTATGDLPVTFISGPGVAVSAEANGLRLYGEEGTLLAEGGFSFAIARVRAPGEPPEPVPVPRCLLDALPAVGDDTQNKWCALARDFVADIRDVPHRPYPTFRDGWRYQVAIDAIRAGTGWRDLPSDAAARGASVA